jgi:hypothetical protein
MIDFIGFEVRFVFAFESNLYGFRRVLIGGVFGWREERWDEGVWVGVVVVVGGVWLV